MPVRTQSDNEETDNSSQYRKEMMIKGDEDSEMVKETMLGKNMMRRKRKWMREILRRKMRKRK